MDKQQKHHFILLIIDVLVSRFPLHYFILKYTVTVMLLKSKLLIVVVSAVVCCAAASFSEHQCLCVES